MEAQPQIGQQWFLPVSGLQPLVEQLQRRDYRVMAPVVREGVVMLDQITNAQQIARGVRDEQNGGAYSLESSDAELYFQYVVGPEGPKRYLFPPVQPLLAMHEEDGGFVMDQGVPEPEKLAFLGIRPCEVAAIAVQDRVFGATDPATMRCESDEYYNHARREALLIAVNCTRPGGTCFCASMGTGPAVEKGYDLALTELRGGFIVQIGSVRGAEVAAALPVRQPSGAELELAHLRMDQARQRMGRHLDTEGLPELLDSNLEHPRWDEVARRCLGCGNCTMVCPTCFCSTVTDGGDPGSPSVTRLRHWESCYTHQFSYTTAGPVRSSIRARYRHWMRHKLGTWWEQFGCSGCVGCGRCITWCPVGIDLTEESTAIRATGATSSQGKTTSTNKELWT